MSTTQTAPTDISSPAGRGDILLESGTNELEVLVFEVCDQRFGVNVAKVREVILNTKVAVSPGQPAAVRGMLNLRGNLHPLVDLAKALDLTSERDEDLRRIIVTEFNGQRAAFLVDRVEQIHRMSWTQIESVPPIEGPQHPAVTGLTKLDDQLVLMLDFESISDQIAMQDQLHIGAVPNPRNIDRANARVLLAEDSRFIGDLMKRVLIQSGYAHTDLHLNGQSAWDKLESTAKAGDPLPDLVVSDIEMPRMDGLALTKRIKDHPAMHHIPVVLFSSLITEDTLHKGKKVGADAQINKPQLSEMVELIDGFVESPPHATAAAA
ncbi:MAG: chemotaxis protein [Planctomycetota bacterium]